MIDEIPSWVFKWLDMPIDSPICSKCGYWPCECEIHDEANHVYPAEPVSEERIKEMVAYATSEDEKDKKTARLIAAIFAADPDNSDEGEQG